MEARSFDVEAATFDARVGLPPEVLDAVAAAVGRFLPPRGLGALLDLGAGTGALGERLVEQAGRYVGLDVSRPMLGAFARRVPERRRHVLALLVQADAARPWPLTRKSFDVVFASRAFHRFPLAPAIEEVFRTTVPGGAFLLGGIRRSPGGGRAALRGRLHEALRRRGLSPRNASANAQEAIGMCLVRGGRALEPITVARWRASRTAAETFDAWRFRAGLAGLDLPRETKADVLLELEPWALSRAGRPEDEEESYVLEGALLA